VDVDTIKEDREDIRKKLDTMSKEELIAQFIKAKAKTGYDTDSSLDSSDVEEVVEKVKEKVEKKSEVKVKTTKVVKEEPKKEEPKKEAWDDSAGATTSADNMKW